MLIAKLIKLSVTALAGAAGAMLLIFAITTGDYSVAKTVAQDPSLPSIQINGRLLHAQAFGHPDNQVVIVIHGGPGWDYKSLLPLKA
ncbi:MAG: hypothetical protein OEV92_12305, partial [Nitrospinota bacterium]|nr:hypothetical protein [Nitrospinota bacterium]